MAFLFYPMKASDILTMVISQRNHCQKTQAVDFVCFLG